jgi:hypothetical protein
VELDHVGHRAERRTGLGVDAPRLVRVRVGVRVRVRARIRVRVRVG